MMAAQAVKAARAAPAGVEQQPSAQAQQQPHPGSQREDGAAAASAAAEARAPFAWVDGPLVTAMRRGDMILVDEINLAEDAVLERLNRWAGGACSNSVVALVWHVAGVTVVPGVDVALRRCHSPRSCTLRACYDHARVTPLRSCHS